MLGRVSRVLAVGARWDNGTRDLIFLVELMSLVDGLHCRLVTIDTYYYDSY